MKNKYYTPFSSSNSRSQYQHHGRMIYNKGVIFLHSIFWQQYHTALFFFLPISNGNRGDRAVGAWSWLPNDDDVRVSNQKSKKCRFGRFQAESPFWVTSYAHSVRTPGSRPKSVAESFRALHNTYALGIMLWSITMTSTLRLYHVSLLLDALDTSFIPKYLTELNLLVVVEFM